MPQINLGGIYWTFRWKEKWTDPITFPVQVPRNWYFVRLWALLPMLTRMFCENLASFGKISGFWVFYWAMRIIERYKTIEWGLENGYITQEEFDKAYPDENDSFW